MALLLHTTTRLAHAARRRRGFAAGFSATARRSSAAMESESCWETSPADMFFSFLRFELVTKNEMTESEADWQFINYGNTYHAFTNPLANDVAMGTVYNHESDKRSWIAMTNFLEEVFGNVNK